ncbi:MAG TPA: PQQ-binding-like beta-propeller repeat protein [Gemmataceae bacterium]|nr:PQQ-binding-like beta-propeller repeat protein [Gemmataceae bacterium]
MPCCPWMTRLRWLLALVPVAAVLVVAGIACSNALRPAPRPEAEETADKDAPAPKGGDRSCPMFGCTPARNMANPVEKNIPAEWSVKEGERKNVKWSAQLGTRGYFSPAVASGKVFIPTNNGNPRDPKVQGPKAVLMCFRESDGKFLWQLAHDMPPRDVAREAGEDGLVSVPCVEGDRLWYVTPAAVVVCATTDGKVVWQYDLMKELKVFPCYCAASSPLVAGDRVFLVTGNGRNGEAELPSPDAPSFVALDKKTGKLLWKDSSPGKNIMEGQWTSPAYGVIGGKPQVIFPGGDGWLYAFNPGDGKLLWKFDCNLKSAPPFKPGGRHPRNYILAAPVIHDDKVYIGTGQLADNGPGPAHFWCIDATKTGDLSPAGDNLDPKAEVNQKSGLVWHYGGAITPKPKKGRDVIFGRTYSTAAIHDGLVYIAELDGVLHCLDARTGQKYWSHDTKAAVWGSAYYVDGKVYLGTEDSEVNVFPAGKKPPPRDVPKNECERTVKATPVAVNGVLYVVAEGTLYAIANK